MVLILWIKLRNAILMYLKCISSLSFIIWISCSVSTWNVQRTISSAKLNWLQHFFNITKKNSNAVLEQMTWTQCCRGGLSWETGLWETMRGRLNKPAKSLHTTANSHRPQAICQITYWSPVYQAKSNGTRSHLGQQAQLAQLAHS